MRLLSLAAVSILSRIAAASSFSPYTLNDVQADISSYLDHNATHQTRGVSNFGCDVAVSIAPDFCDGKFRTPSHARG